MTVRVLRHAAATAMLCAATGMVAACGTPVPPTDAGAAPAVTASSAAGMRQDATVVRAIDGDTLLVRVDDRTQRVRLIGVDTPETVKPDTPVQCWGKQASAHTAARAGRGTAVTLESDPVAGRHDRYGRTLAYVWLPDGIMLDEELIAEGYGREYDYADQPYRYRPQLRAAQDAARAAGRGLWSACPQ
ncbi:thermonuclease family protein [Williamsia serinedens]|uniref:Micrococcal nuclease n=1 Tax=Williamsia serinedens TaxID=391736 RepID=A0ABT1HB51_9NOCA|nr:thermonuclease family protein [Williamsia serinedens]MCP2163058.1 micrococcal nuclease [Williamsia serinedens]